MTLWIKKPLRVRQDGNNLVAAYHTANPPLIWKFDLERNHSFAVALQGEDGDWELGVVSPREEFHPVARFLSREDAEEAFAKTQTALLRKKPNIWRAISITSMVITVLLVVVICMMVMLNYARNAGIKFPVASSQHSPIPAYPQMEPQMPAGYPDLQLPPGFPSASPAGSLPALPAPSSPPPAPMKDGVPQDADKVLRSQ